MKPILAFVLMISLVLSMAGCAAASSFDIALVESYTDIPGVTEFEAVTSIDTPWPDILEKLETGEVSMITQLLYTDERKGHYLWSSVPYAASYYALLSKLDYPELAMYQVIRTTVGLIDQTGHNDMYKLWFPGSDNTITYPTHEDALVALEKGEIDFLMASEYTLLHQTNYREKTTFKENIRFTEPMDSMFGFNKDETLLCSIIDKTLPFINTEIIVRGWTGRIFDNSTKYAVQLSAFLAVFIAVLLCILAIAVYLLLKNRRLGKRLEREAATVSSIYATIPDMVYCKDENCNYLSCNASFERLVGLKESEIIGKSALDLFPLNEKMAHDIIESDKETLRTCSMITTEEVFIYPDRTQRLFETIKTPLMQNGTLIGVLGISRDITEHKAALKAAQAASRAKSTFLAQMSHEIRTPMNVITGMTELILREGIPRAIYENMLGIKHASNNLLSMINDILDYSKIEEGSLDIINSEYSFTSLINDVLIITRMKLREKLILFTVNIDCNIPNRLIGDVTRVRQILLNVLGNAANYTNEGYVSLTVTGEISAHEIALTAEVSDSGVGIRQEDMAVLFDNFNRFDREKHNGITGSGLGLAITKSLCRAMGGDISARSEYGKGSTFTITVIQKLNNPKEKFAQVTDMDTTRVLLFETRSIYANSIVRSLDNLGVCHTLAASRQEFYKALKSGGYSYVFVSSMLFDSVVQIISELGQKTRLVLLMELGEALTAHEIHDVKTIAMPVHAASIASILNDTQDNIFYNEIEDICFIAPGASVLVVDDLKTNLKVAEGLLLPYQIQVDVSGSGAQAIQYVRENRYDIIFIDHMMPEMDGIEATGYIRSMKSSDGYYQNVPIIALTANAVSGAKEMFMQNGMNDFLAKPIDIVKLNSILEKWIPKDKREKYLDKNAIHQMINTEYISIKGVDVRAGILMTGGTVDNYLKTLDIFHMDVLEKIEKIRDCVEKNEIKLYTTYVHALKSASASIGAAEVSEYAKKLELAGINGDILLIRDQTEPFLGQLQILLEKISVVLPKEQTESELEYEPQFVKIRILKLREALSNMDFEEVEESVRALRTTIWNQKAGDIYTEISRNVSLFQYKEAAAMIDDLINAYTKS